MPAQDGEAQKRQATAKEDFQKALEAKRNFDRTLQSMKGNDEKNRQIAERRALDKKIHELEMVKISAAEKEDYDEASRLKEEIARLQEMANELPQADPETDKTGGDGAAAASPENAGAVVPHSGDTVVPSSVKRTPKKHSASKDKVARVEPWGSKITDLKGQWWHSVAGLGAIIVKGDKVQLPESGMMMRLAEADDTIILTVRNLAWAMDQKNSNEGKVIWNNRSDGRFACYWMRSAKRARYWDRQEGVSQAFKKIKPKRPEIPALQDAPGGPRTRPVKMHRRPPPPTDEDIKAWEPFMNMALDEANRSIAANNHPFGAVLVLDGKDILRGQSSVVTEGDPTCRAEVNLVRAACRDFDADKLKRSTIVCSTEPCPMCAGAIYWAGIGQIVYGCSAFELGDICGEELHLTCLDVVSTGKQHNVKVIGPILRDKAVEMHRQFWKEEEDQNEALEDSAAETQAQAEEEADEEVAETNAEMEFDKEFERAPNTAGDGLDEDDEDFGEDDEEFEPQQ